MISSFLAGTCNCTDSLAEILRNEHHKFESTVVTVVKKRKTQSFSQRHATVHLTCGKSQ